MENFTSSALAFQSVLINFPKSKLHSKAEYQIGLSYVRRSDFKSAIGQFEKIIDKYPKEDNVRVSALYQLGNALFNSSRYDDSIKIFKQLIKEYPDSDEFHRGIYGLGLSYYSSGDEKEALSVFKSYISQYPTGGVIPEVQFWLGQYYYDKGLYDAAYEYFKKLKDSYPGSPFAPQSVFYMVEILMKNGLKSDARACLKEVITRYPDTNFEKESYEKLGTLAMDDGRYDEAIEAYNKSLTSEKNSRNCHIHVQIGECYEKQGRIEEAEREYLKAAYLFPDVPYWPVNAQLNVARLLEGQNKWDEAKKVYEKLSSLDRDEGRYAKERLEWIRENIRK